MVISVMRLIALESLPPIQEVISATKDIAVICGVLVGLATYVSRGQQEKFSNSFKIIESFTKHISDDDLEVLRSIHLNTYEGCRGFKYGYFLTYRDGEPILNPIASLFLQEGRGLSVQGVLNSTSASSEQDGETFLGAARLIAEQLNLISFEVLKSQIEVRIVYYELNEVVGIICRFLDISIETDTNGIYHLEHRFQYLLKMRKKFPPSKFPKRTFSSL
ncbi:MAG: hypothetical protein WA984_10925 [Phormidesmis sp.]